jgi:hypothetical protein
MAAVSRSRVRRKGGTIRVVEPEAMVVVSPVNRTRERKVVLGCLPEKMVMVLDCWPSGGCRRVAGAWRCRGDGGRDLQER